MDTSKELTLEELRKYVPVANHAKEIIWHELVNELKLQAPSRFVLASRNEMVWLLAVMNPRALGTSIQKYYKPLVAHQISTAFAGKPVFIANNTGLRYGVLLSQKPKLAKLIAFPGFGEKRDLFRLGHTLQGEVSISAAQMKNLLIGAAQGSGKSNLLSLLVHQMRAFGWQLYLADPQLHTFPPDIWHNLAAAPVASKDEEVLMVLERIQAEIERRMALFRAISDGGIPPRDIDVYNGISPEPLARIGFLVDEANTFLGNPAIFDKLADLLRQGRKWGLHIILAGHEWHKKDVPSRVNDMLQTRLALSTPDENSGRVVLRNTQLGRWVMDQPSGRGVLKARGKFQRMQFYLVTDEQQREWLSTQETPGPLTAEEIAYVDFALEQDAEFKISTLVEKFGKSEWVFRKLAKAWEQRGWLIPGRSAADPRVMSETLIELAGLTPGFQEKTLARSYASDALGRVSHASHDLSHDSRTLARPLARVSQ
jgi:hypothetical protein